MDDQALKVLIVAALSSGCGAVNQLIMWQLIKWRDEDGSPISAKTKRRVALLLAGVTPTALYGFIVYMGWEAYGVAAHASYVGLAFIAAQALHGELKLPNREQEIHAERVAYAEIERAVTERGPAGGVVGGDVGGGGG